MQSTRASELSTSKVLFGFVLLAPLIVLGFWRTYFGILDVLPAHITTLFHVHALSMVLWLAMLVTQALLIGTRRYELHRKIGRSSFLIVPAIVVIGLLTSQATLTRSPDALTPELARLNVFAFGQMGGFFVTWALAILFRKRAELHVRFIVSTAFAIAPAIVLRILFFWVPGFEAEADRVLGNLVVLLAPLLVLIALDWRAGIKCSPFWVVTVILAATHIGYWTFADTTAWYELMEAFAYFGD